MLQTYTETVVFDRYQEIRAALFNPDLSRTFDRRSYDEGNVRDGVVSIAHGATHRNRRRVENTQFRSDRLRQYEQELFPEVLARLAERLTGEGSADLFPVGELLSVVLAARRAGIDCDEDSLDDLRTLVGYVDAFSQGSAILDARDPDAVRSLVRNALDDFAEHFLRPSRARREEIVARYRAGEVGEDALGHDILTVLLLHADDPKLELTDQGRVVREVATYLQGGTHTSSQTLINTLDLLLPASADDPSLVQRVIDDRLFAQRCVHETLRLRPTTPKIKRRAEADTEVAGRAIRADSLVVLDAATGNRDAGVFGADAEAFNPDRVVADGVPRWGLSFGAGPHQCPGRSVAGGFPVPDSFEVDGDHVFGLVALMVQEMLRRGVRPDPDRAPQRDDRTERYTRWMSYPVVFSR